MSLLQRVSSAIQYYGTLSMIRLVLAMPYHAAISLGRSIMFLVWLFMPLRRKIVKIQMSTALGLDNPWRLGLKVFMNQGEIMVDAIKYAYMSDEEIKARIIVEGKEYLDEARASGRGLVMFTGHIGNWEVLSHISRLLNIEFCHMADIRKDARLESIISEMRDRSGITLLPPKGKALMLIKELKKGRIISMIIDQRGKLKNGILCNFFGLPAPTNPGPAFIAIKGGALVQPVYIVKLHGTYHIRIGKAVDSADFGVGQDAIQGLSDFMHTWVASVVERYPDQWFWLHSRWVKRTKFSKLIKTDNDFQEIIKVQTEEIRSREKKS
jgi:Kdo2-lipid IVA lauroyltransferase/acyltransferase